MKQIAQGAEAKLFENENGDIVKDRFEKKYRHSKIDNKLRGSRTRREAKILSKLKELGFPAPRLIKCDKKKEIVMQKIEGDKLRNVLEKDDYVKLSKEIGKKVKRLHDAGIIHSDLTTSNMILADSGEIYFIDFGLSFFSEKIEDKAVDLHLLKEALKSKHHKVWEECFDSVLEGYNNGEVVLRLEKVEKRGKYKTKT